MLDNWYHICLKLDLQKSEIEAHIDGQMIGRVHSKNITNKPDKLAIKIGLGHDNKQFQGSMTNMKVLQEINSSKTLTRPCEQGQDDILSWSPENWTLVGFQWTLVEEFEDEVCNSSDFYNLAISPLLTINESRALCKGKFNNSMISFEHDNNLFLRYIDWHVETIGGACSYIWTPLTKMENGDSFINMNDNTETTVLNSARGQPNGGSNENLC